MQSVHQWFLYQKLHPNLWNFHLFIKISFGKFECKNFIPFQWPVIQWAKTHCKKTARKFTSWSRNFCNDQKFFLKHYWHYCFMGAFFFCVKDIVINWESVTNPRYSIDLVGTNIDLSGWITNPRHVLKSYSKFNISFIFNKTSAECN